MPDILDLSIVIVSWNTSDELRACISSVFADNPGRMEVIVVDNASKDGSPDMVRREFPDVHLIANTDNFGFGKASNQGIAIAKGRLIMLLNPDSEVRRGAFSSIIEYAKANPDIGIFGIKVLNPDGSIQYSCRHFPTLQAGIFRNTILGHFFPKNPYTKDYLMTEWDHMEARDVDWVSGCAMVLRREFVDDLGGFDERFFMYCEDVDLGYRAMEKGWRVSYLPYAVVVHARAKSSDKNANPMIIEFHKSMYYFFKKHYLKDASLFVRMIVPLGLIARASFFVMRNYFYRAKWYVKRRFAKH